MSKQATKTLEAARPDRDPLSPFGHEMLALFRGPLAEVRFPDLDRATLDEAADEVVRAQIEVETLERSLEAARQRGQAAQASFVHTATRALAYARIFATGQPVIEAVLAGSPVLTAAGPAPAMGLAEGRADDQEKKKRRGRPKKDVTTAELLPMETEASADEAVAAA